MSTEAPSPSQPRRQLGALGILFMVVAAAAPLTIMSATGPFLLAVGGVGAPIAFIIAGVVLFIFVFGFMRMTKATRGVGAFYSYVTIGLGRRAGAATGIVALVSYNAFQLGTYGLLGVQFSAAFAQFSGGVTLPWWLFSLVVVVIVFLLGRRGADVSARILGALLVVETTLLGAMVVAVVAQGGANGLHLGSFQPGNWSTPGFVAAASVAFACFMGVEATVLYRAEARNPEKSISRATYGAVAFLALFYCVALWAIVQATGEQRAVETAAADPTAMLTSTITQYLGVWASDVTYVFLLGSVFASQVSFHNAINRYTRTLAGDGLLPARLALLHPRLGSPARAGAVQSILAAVVICAFALAGADPYLQLTIWVSTPGIIGILGLQTLASAAVFAYFKNRPGSGLTRAVAVLATLLLGTATVLLSRNTALLTGAGQTTNRIIVLVPAVCFLFGSLLATYLKHKRPHVYDGIGGDEVRAMRAATNSAGAETGRAGVSTTS